jgi:hypothetical protein
MTPAVVGVSLGVRRRSLGSSFWTSCDSAPQLERVHLSTDSSSSMEGDRSSIILDRQPPDNGG